MPNYAAARINMVDSQIHPSGVVSAPVLDAFRTVPREMFVPEDLRGRVYADEDLMLGNGQFLMDPAVLARMIEAANVQPQDVILNIGDSTGYSSAILAELAKPLLPIAIVRVRHPAV
jgi:protein-L-isoaspartate(D-aspartate) O-methyltransferase